MLPGATEKQGKRGANHFRQQAFWRVSAAPSRRRLYHRIKLVSGLETSQWQSRSCSLEATHIPCNSLEITHFENAWLLLASLNLFLRHDVLLPSFPDFGSLLLSPLCTALRTFSPGAPLPEKILFIMRTAAQRKESAAPIGSSSQELPKPMCLSPHLDSPRQSIHRGGKKNQTTKQNKKPRRKQD